MAAQPSGYQILRRAPKTEPAFSVLVEDTGNANTTYADATARVNTRYIYRVKAFNAAGTGPEAGPAEIFYESMPGTPTGLSAQIDEDGSAVVLTWNAPTSGAAATGYRILRRVAGGASSLSVLVDDTGNTDTTYSDATAEVNTEYIYRVKAVNSDGAGEMSARAEIFFTDKPGPPTALSAGAEANVDRAGFAVTLKWAAPTGPNTPTGYQILRREADSTSALSVLVDDTGNANTTYRDTAVAVGKSYIYRLKARNAAGLGEASQPAQVRIEDFHVKTVCGFDDCIQPIYNPSFLDAGDVGDRIRADEYVIGVSINGESRAYPVDYLGAKSIEIVNDTVGGTPIVVTWCPLCMTTIVYERTVGDEVYDFGMAGKLMQRGAARVSKCLVLYDHQTRSLVGPGPGPGRQRSPQRR